MTEKKLVFKYSKHRKLWAAMPEYILQEAKTAKHEESMQVIVCRAKIRAFLELFPYELYASYQCFACQYTKEYTELYCQVVREKDCGLCPLDWGTTPPCWFYNRLESLLFFGSVDEEYMRYLCRCIYNLPVKAGVEIE